MINQLLNTRNNIGDRTGAASGTNSDGSWRTASYSANSDNQYTSRTVPSVVDILGIANPQASVTVNGSNADYRREVEPPTPTIAREVPSQERRRVKLTPNDSALEQLLGGERDTRKESAPTQTQHPNALPTSWRCLARHSTERRRLPVNSEGLGRCFTLFLRSELR
jgi:hypothetical protein